MPLIDLQRRMRELGRIRTGEQVVEGGRRRPTKLATFRITSPSKQIIEAAADAYGGEPREWQSPSGKQWEVVTTSESLDIVIPPGQSISQWWELWSGGGCQRRCDGRTNVIEDEPCVCPADPIERREAAAQGRACKPTTRLNVMLPALPDLGVFRLESHGYYAAVELAGTASFLEVAAASGRLMPAKLRLEQREKKVPGKPVNRFAVPVIEIATRLVDLIGDMPGLPEGRVEHPRLTATNKRERTERPDLGNAPSLPSGEAFEPEHSPAAAGRSSSPTPAAAPSLCNATSPYDEGSEPCAREEGHSGLHKNHARESWGGAA